MNNTITASRMHSLFNPELESAEYAATESEAS